MLSLLLSIGLGASAVLAQNSTTGKTCTIPSKYTSSNGTADDSPAIASAFADCASGGTVVFSEGVNYNVFKPILAENLTDVSIEVLGNLHLPQDIESTRKLILASSQTVWWFDFRGSNIHYTGSQDPKHGWINSYGQQWWDANPSNGTGITGRPHLMMFNVTGGSIKRLKSRKPIAWNVQIKGSDIDISDSIVDAVSDKWESFPFNTDAFDIGASNVRITNLVAYNGDDAVAVNDGAHNLYVSDSTIGYQTHGLSIGSLGKSQGKFANVSNIHFDRITVAGGLYAARLKSWVGGQGLVSNVSWTNIKVHNVTFPVFITQTYVDQGNTGSAERPNNSSVELRDFTFGNFTGDINSFNPGDGSCRTNPCWYDQGLPNLKQTDALIIECNTNTSCSGFETYGINIYPQKQEAPSIICVNAGAEQNPALGFECANGTFVPQ